MMQEACKGEKNSTTKTKVKNSVTMKLMQPQAIQHLHICRGVAEYIHS